MNELFFFTLPAEKEILETKGLVEQKLAVIRSSRTLNSMAERGYEASIDVLTKDIRDRDSLLLTVPDLGGSVLPLLAIDYLNGACDREVLLGAIEGSLC
jgi:hypothetical protein